MLEKLTAVEIPPSAAHRYTIILLHGLGADGRDFDALIPELQLAQQDHIRFLLPNAPVMPVTINAGFKMSAWFDISDSTLIRRVDSEGIYRSSALLAELIRKEIAQGIPSEFK